jgi:hypothetical protein
MGSISVEQGGNHQPVVRTYKVRGRARLRAWGGRGAMNARRGDLAGKTEYRAAWARYWRDGMGTTSRWWGEPIRCEVEAGCEAGGAGGQ